MYKSDIRPSVINALLTKVSNKSYDKYLPKVVLKKVRGFSDEVVTFDFPVTAIIGPNGGGKTTVLGAAACAYKDVPPKRFFAKSGKYDDSMMDWTIAYDLVDRSVNRRDVVRRTASFKSARWKRDALHRESLIFGVARTVPATERAELRRCASNTFSVPTSNVVSFSDRVTVAVARILNKDIKEFRGLKINSSGQVRFLTGKTPSGSGYSEFHFGAGESSIINLVFQVESVSDSSIIFIEEIENGLHPVATIKLVEYLIEVADRKKVQVVFTTHSNAALLPLPDKAIWVATRDRLFQGKLDVESLRAITREIDKQAVVFVEDAFAKNWVQSVVRHLQSAFLDIIEVHAMSGDGIAVAMNKYHNDNPAIQIPSICIIDGDSKQKDSATELVFRLPGDQPEAFVFDQVIEAWDQVGGTLTVSLFQPFAKTDYVRDMCEEVRRLNMDPHLLFSQVGEKLGFIPEQTVATAFCTCWAQAHPDAAGLVTECIRSVLPTT